MPDAHAPVVLHASAVAAGQRGLLIIGQAGAGKSTLAIELMAIGATLVADDRVELRPDSGGGLILSAPQPIRGMVEARGLGLIAMPAASARAHLVVDLDRVSTERLPHSDEIVIAGTPLPRIARVESPAFASMLWLCLIGERTEP